MNSEKIIKNTPNNSAVFNLSFFIAFIGVIICIIAKEIVLENIIPFQSGLKSDVYLLICYSILFLIFYSLVSYLFNQKNVLQYQALSLFIALDFILIFYIINNLEIFILYIFQFILFFNIVACFLKFENTFITNKLPFIVVISGLVILLITHLLNYFHLIEIQNYLFLSSLSYLIITTSLVFTGSFFLFKKIILDIQIILIYTIFISICIYTLDKYIFNHVDFSPLTEFQFYGILFIVVFGLIAGFMFYRENEETVEEVSEFRTKMDKKKLKKSKKAKARSR